MIEESRKIFEKITLFNCDNNDIGPLMYKCKKFEMRVCENVWIDHEQIYETNIEPTVEEFAFYCSTLSTCVDYAD